MYLVAGANIFGQWFSDKTIISSFEPLTGNDTSNLKFHLQEATLIDMNWSYNIYQIQNRFYLCGSWRGKEQQCIQVKLPDECEQLYEPNSLTMAGNDYNLLLVNLKTRTLWVMDFENDEVKKLTIGVETPLTEPIIHKNKKIKCDNGVIKVATMNNSCLYLTADGSVYSGLLPSLLDTSHCEGKVCDIQLGYEHFMLLTDTGKVYTWGNGRRLQLGHGDVTNFDSPKLLEGLAGIKIVKISAGGWHSFALSESGDLYAWGWNDTGQLGIQSDQMNSKGHGVLKKDGLNSYTLPTIVEFYDEDGNEISLDVKDIACGNRHSAVLLEDNSVWMSGYNKYGQLACPVETKPVINYFRKTFQCEFEAEIMSGPWSTVIKNK